MRTLLFSLFFFFNFHNSYTKFSVTIWDSNYSMSYTMYYHVSNDSLVVKKFSGISNEKDSVIINEKLSQKNCLLISNFLRDFKVNKLKNKYADPFINDGDQKKIVIQIRGKAKTIEVANVYQKEIASLFDILNQILPRGLKISYGN